MAPVGPSHRDPYLTDDLDYLGEYEPQSHDLRFDSILTRLIYLFEVKTLVMNHSISRGPVALLRGNFVWRPKRFEFGALTAESCGLKVSDGSGWCLPYCYVVCAPIFRTNRSAEVCPLALIARFSRRRWCHWCRLCLQRQKQLYGATTAADSDWSSSSF